MFVQSLGAAQVSKDEMAVKVNNTESGTKGHIVRTIFF